MFLLGFFIDRSKQRVKDMIRCLCIVLKEGETVAALLKREWTETSVRHRNIFLAAMSRSEQAFNVTQKVD